MFENDIDWYHIEDSLGHPDPLDKCAEERHPDEGEGDENDANEECKDKLIDGVFEAEIAAIPASKAAA